MNKDQLIIERTIEKIIIPEKDRKKWLDKYLNESRSSVQQEPPLPSVREILKKKEDGNLSEFQLTTLDLIKRVLNQKRAILIDIISKNPRKSHKELEKMVAEKIPGYSKKNCFDDIDFLRKAKIIREDNMKGRSHPKHVFMCDEFDLLSKALLQVR
jgi:hypothetical protein